MGFEVSRVFQLCCFVFSQVSRGPTAPADTVPNNTVAIPESQPSETSKHPKPCSLDCRFPTLRLGGDSLGLRQLSRLCYKSIGLGALWFWRNVEDQTPKLHALAAKVCGRHAKSSDTRCRPAASASFTEVGFGVYVGFRV